jgi:acyl-coenzyme A synthetase/AMP-(fatty) acid ligase
MIWLGTDGEERRLTFGDFSQLSNKFANAARAMGVGRGDRVMVLLGKIPEWHAILTGLLKRGAIAIPCAPQLRSGDLKFRADHSGPTMIVADPEGVGEVEKRCAVMLPACSTSFLRRGERRLVFFRATHGRRLGGIHSSRHIL